MTIKVNDFVIASIDIDEVEKRSVGQVRKIFDEHLEVFFIGKGVEKRTSINNVLFLDITKTGKPYKEKICNICHQLKNDPGEFDINQTDAKGRKTTRPSCKICRIAIDGEPLNSSDRVKFMKMKPRGIFTCPLCGKTSIVGVTANIVIDHNHNTGRARMWICDSCNTGLGRFKDDIALLNNAISYLKELE